MWKGFKVVSDDSHFEGKPDMWRPYVAKEFQVHVPKVVKMAEGHGWLIGNEEPVPMGTNLSAGRPYLEIKRSGVSYDEPGLPGIGDGAQRLREMDRDGVDAEVIYPPVGALKSLFDKLPAEANIALAQGYNDWLTKEYAAADPRRILGLAMLPQAGVKATIAELERIKGKPGIAGAVIHQWPNGSKVPTPEDDLFWAAALKSGVPLTFHIAFGGGPETEVRPANELNWAPINVLLARNGPTAYTITRMITAGIFDRFPELRFSVAEAGASWLLFFKGKADSNYARHRGWAKLNLPHVPSYYVDKHFMFGIQEDYAAVRVRNEIGVENICWGSDFPHSATDWPNSKRVLDKLFDGVPKDEVKKMVGGNIARHFKLDLDAIPTAAG